MKKEIHPGRLICVFSEKSVRTKTATKVLPPHSCISFSPFTITTYDKQLFTGLGMVFLYRMVEPASPRFYPHYSFNIFSYVWRIIYMIDAFFFLLFFMVSCAGSKTWISLIEGSASIIPASYTPISQYDLTALKPLTNQRFLYQVLRQALQGASACGSPRLYEIQRRTLQ